ncbi:unnamed protein product [Amoebophrya sp. A120]|nr:unnamed protein product [Amoebophrya sp. A120]|eukprot:GSA120T00013521001.1
MSRFLNEDPNVHETETGRFFTQLRNGVEEIRMPWYIRRDRKTVRLIPLRKHATAVYRSISETPANGSNARTPYETSRPSYEQMRRRYDLPPLNLSRVDSRPTVTSLHMDRELKKNYSPRQKFLNPMNKTRALSWANQRFRAAAAREKR